MGTIYCNESAPGAFRCLPRGARPAAPSRPASRPPPAAPRPARGLRAAPAGVPTREGLGLPRSGAAPPRAASLLLSGDPSPVCPLPSPPTFPLSVKDRSGMGMLGILGITGDTGSTRDTGMGLLGITGGYWELLGLFCEWDTGSTGSPRMGILGITGDTVAPPR